MHIPTGEIVRLDKESEFLKKITEARDEKIKHELNKRQSDIDSSMVALTDDEEKLLMPLSKRRRKGVMRNQPCVCGSGKKFKKCCWHKFS